MADKIWDPIRALSVEATPEEQVRQMWILRMIGQLGYPKGLLSVEKEISAGRRIDLICYTPGNGGLEPLLLIECKAEEHFPLAERQVSGYNAFVKAPFICVICGNKAKTFWQETSKIASVPFLPTYEQLLHSLRVRH
jgi:hypothetical protein